MVLSKASAAKPTFLASGEGLESAITWLLWMYLLMLPMAHWLAPSGWLPLTNVPLLCAIPLMLLNGAGRFRVVWRDVVLLGLLVLAVLSTLLNADILTSKSLNHMMAVLFVILLNYFVGGRLLFHYLPNDWHRPLLLGFLLSCGLCVFEYWLVNFQGTPLPGYRPDMQDYGSTYIFGVRPRSTFSESGHFAFYLACVVPFLLAAYIQEKRSSVVAWILASFFACAVLLFSTSLFLVIVMWLGLYACIRKLYRKPWGFVLMAAGVASAVIFASYFLAFAEAVIFAKFKSTSFDDRHERFTATLDAIANSDALHVLFGNGMGSFVGLGLQDSISSYANFGRDAGLVGLLFFVLAIFPVEAFYRSVPLLWRRAMLFFGLGIMFFFTAVPNYYFPHVAFALGLMSTLGYSARVENKIAEDG